MTFHPDALPEPRPDRDPCTAAAAPNTGPGTADGSFSSGRSPASSRSNGVVAVTYPQPPQLSPRPRALAPASPWGTFAEQLTPHYHPPHPASPTVANQTPNAALLSPAWVDPGHARHPTAPFPAAAQPYAPFTAGSPGRRGPGPPTPPATYPAPAGDNVRRALSWDGPDTDANPFFYHRARPDPGAPPLHAVWSHAQVLPGAVPAPASVLHGGTLSRPPGLRSDPWALGPTQRFRPQLARPLNVQLQAPPLQGSRKASL